MSWAEGSAYQLYVFAGSPGYIDDAVALRFNTARSGFASDAKRFLHHDDLFSVVAVTDAAGGVLDRSV